MEFGGALVIVERHLRWRHWRLNLRFVFGIEKALDTELEEARGDFGCSWERPVQVDAFVHFGKSLLCGHNFVELWWQLLDKDIFQILGDLVSDSSDEELFESVCNFGDDVAVNVDVKVVFGQVDVDLWDGEGGHGLTVGKLLGGNSNGGSNGHVRNVDRYGAFAQQDAELVSETA